MSGSLQLETGKRVVAPATTAAASSPTGAPLIYLKDRRSHISYLVDTGAAISLVPYKSPLKASGPDIVNVSGQKISTWQFVSKILHFGPRKIFHTFLQAEVSQPILGMDFCQFTLFQLIFNKIESFFPPQNLPPKTSSQNCQSMLHHKFCHNKLPHLQFQPQLLCNLTLLNFCLTFHLSQLRLKFGQSHCIQSLILCTQQAPPFLRVRAVCTRANWKWHKSLLRNWNVWALFAVLLPLGLPHCTWCQNRMVHGDLVGIIAV